MKLTPRLVSNQSIIARGGAEPPQTIAFKLDGSYLPGFCCNSFITPSQIVGTPPVNVTLSASSIWQTETPSIVGPGKTCFAPSMQQMYGNPQALAWTIGTMAITVSARVSPSMSGRPPVMV